VWNALQHFKGVPRYFWKEDSESSTGSVEEDKKILVQTIKRNLLEEMTERYGFVVEGNL
jgi:transcription initiation factor IIE alpha subunit